MVETLKPESMKAASIIETISELNRKIDILIEIAKEHRQLQDSVTHIEGRVCELEETIKTAQSENRI